MLSLRGATLAIPPMSFSFIPGSIMTRKCRMTSSPISGFPLPTSILESARDRTPSKPEKR
jgi:hypothetical protein